MIKIDETNNELLCPVCGAEYHHLHRVGAEMDPAGDENKSVSGTSLIFECTTGYRRTALRIELAGECGHNWSLILQQHKGRIFVLTRNDPPPPIHGEWGRERLVK